MKQLLLSFIMLFSLTFIGCKDDDDKFNQTEALNQLLGTWARQDSPTVTTYKKYNRDYTFEMSSYNSETQITSIGNTYSFKLRKGEIGYEERGHFDWYPYSVNGNTMINASGSTWNRVYQ